jgi:hypothetical protein
MKIVVVSKRFTCHLVRYTTGACVAPPEDLYIPNRDNKSQQLLPEKEGRERHASSVYVQKTDFP